MDGGVALGWEVPCEWLNEVRLLCNARCPREYVEVSFLPRGIALEHIPVCPGSCTVVTGSGSLAIPRSSALPIFRPGPTPRPGPCPGNARCIVRERAPGAPPRSLPLWL